MKTKSEIIAELKKTHPTLKSGSDEIGYTELEADEYEATILQWADNLLAQQTAEFEATQAKAALLNRLGITADEAKLLLSQNNL